MKKFTKIVAVMIVAVMITGFAAGCSKKGVGEYTYRTYMEASPETFNLHMYETNADSVIPSYTGMGLYDYVMTDNGVKFTTEMASGEPVDITSSLTAEQKATYGVTSADKVAYKIPLNQSAVWEDGTTITAEDYVQSWERLLSPKYKNYRATEAYSNQGELANARRYFLSGSSDETYIEYNAIFDYETTGLNIENTYDYFDTADNVGTTVIPVTADNAFLGASLYFYWSYKAEFSKTETYNGTNQPKMTAEGPYTAHFNSAKKAYDEKLAEIKDDTTEADAEAIAAEALRILQEDGIDYVLELLKLIGYEDGADGELKADHVTYEKVKATLGETTFINAAMDIAFNFGDTVPEEQNGELVDVARPASLYEFMALYYETTPTVDFSKVGIYKDGDYNLIFVFANPITEYNLKVNLASTWLVNTRIYDANKSEVGGLWATTYGSSVDTYMSYGPYKLESYQKDKNITLVKNDKWYGYTDGKHDGQFQTTRVNIAIIPNHDTALLEFENGNLDDITLTATDMDKYRNSERILKEDESYTNRLVFNTDAESLKQIESSSTTSNNLVILTNTDFRKGISKAIDRSTYTSQYTAGHKPAFALLNTMYYYNMENDPDSAYRNTQAAKDVVLKLYGKKAEYDAAATQAAKDEIYKSITGYDVNAAKTHFTSAYNAIKSNPEYKVGQEVKINIAASPTTISASAQAQQNYLQSCIDEATKGTDLENKVKITFTVNKDRYAAIASGQVEAMLGAWGGAYLYPFKAIGVYTDPAAVDINEYGFDPKTETLTIDLSAFGKGASETNSIYAWQKIITEGGKYNTESAELKLKVLAEIEYKLLDLCHMVPLSAYTVVSLVSYKVENGLDTFNVLLGFGGTRYRTFNYDDYSWNKLVKKAKTRPSYV